MCLIARLGVRLGLVPPPCDPRRIRCRANGWMDGWMDGLQQANPLVYSFTTNNCAIIKGTVCIKRGAFLTLWRAETRTNKATKKPYKNTVYPETKVSDHPLKLLSDKCLWRLDSLSSPGSSVLS